FVDVVKSLSSLPLNWEKILNHAQNILVTGNKSNELIWGEPKNDSFADAEEVDDSPLEGRDIYFYSEIDRYEALGFIKTLREFRKVASGVSEPRINLHLHSMGGGVFGGFSMMDEILSVRKDVPIDTYIDGAVASAATLLSVVGSKRFIKKNSFFLMHQVSSQLFFGTHQNFQDTEKNLTLFMNHLKAIYQEFTNIPPEKMEELLLHDLWLSAEQCLEWGIVDVILD
ncbi:MAG: ATP-dependent Clp protease proteolytic subunit, partial [Chloroflexi bacterium]|nr:ATP-dependent Clp protease proteolytic subunit [Chloroflexota bacterium]